MLLEPADIGAVGLEQIIEVCTADQTELAHLERIFQHFEAQVEAVRLTAVGLAGSEVFPFFIKLLYQTLLAEQRLAPDQQRRILEYPFNDLQGFLVALHWAIM